MQTDTSWQDLLHPGDATDFFMRRPFPAFDPSTHVYSPINALRLAELSRLVYRHDAEEDDPAPQPTRSHFLDSAGFRQRQFFLSKETGTQAMLVEFAGTAAFTVLVFRGTEQHIKDYLTDLEFGKLSPFGSGKETHAGFTAALDSVWDEIAPAIVRPDGPMFYTGHSLGAALATLAAARQAPRAVYTFGSPRVGNQAFVASLDHVPIHRIVDDEDIVTTVPSEVLGFRHVGTEVRLTAPEHESSIMRVFEPPKPWADHAPVNYVDRL
ncbi:MAG: lipase family protein [Gallionellaceae bacterium]|nr:lipase family protein [Gallionellaceae bacterium]